MNEQITAPRVLVIAPDGERVGELGITEALYLADELGLDLVEVAPEAKPPVVRIADYGKMRYEKSVREREARKHRAKPTKILQFRPVIADGDYNTKLRQLRKFLESGHKVTVTVRLRGRENTTPEVGFAILSRIEGDVAEVGRVDQAPNREGRQISMRLAPAA